MSVECDVETEQRPNEQIRPDSREFTFEFSTPENEYVNMRETEIALTMRFTTESENWTFTPEIDLLDCLIESADIWINDKLLTHTSSLYPYKALFQSLVTCAPGSVNGYKSANRIDPRGGFWKDSSAGKAGPWFELRGKLFLDLSGQQKAILGGCRFKIVLKLSKPSFVVYYSKTGTSSETRSQPSEPSTSLTKPKTTDDDAGDDNDNSINAASLITALKPRDANYEINEIALIVHRACATGRTIDAHRKALNMTTAKYPINRIEMRSINITPNINDFKSGPVFNGQLPRRVAVFFTRSAAVNGDYALSPFSFLHHDINYLAFDIDGVEYPRNAFTPDFERNRFMREYYTFLQSFNLDVPSVEFQIPHSKYKTSTIFAYNFAPDLSGGCCYGHVNLIKKGTFALRIKFKKVPLMPLTALVFAEFDNIIQIDRNGEVSTDYI